MSIRGKRVGVVANWLVTVAVGLALTPSTNAVSGFYHNLDRNRQPCSDCHTQHYEEDGSAPADVEPGGPFDVLRRRETTNKLCLFCHDGSDPNAPDVLFPVVMYFGSGDEHSGAGFFSNVGFKNDNGHDLGGTGDNVEFGSAVNVILTCASCHDPHGTPNYRNLLADPIGASGIAVVMGADVFRDAAPGDPPSPAASVAAYRESNEGYKASTSRWCAACHDQLLPTVNTPANREHHLTDVPINGPGYPTDPAHWITGVGNGFGVESGDPVEGVPRLRFQVPTATDYVSSRLVAADNEVMCMTCHFAHGGPFKGGFVWPADGGPGGSADRDSGCNQCHNF